VPAEQRGERGSGTCLTATTDAVTIRERLQGQGTRGGDEVAYRGLTLAAVFCICLGAPGANAWAAPVVAAAGDIACKPGVEPSANACQQAATARLLLEIAPDRVLALGDEQYEQGTLDEFENSYDKSWGKVKSITSPTPGNHEYDTAGASGYYSYFGAAAGDPDKGYYSFDLGAWHLLALNSNCRHVSCAAGSAQERWLHADLAAHPNQCLLAYWHHNTFDSTHDLRTDLFSAGVDLLLVGHDHSFVNGGNLDASGHDDPKGYRQFTVGTGGKSGGTFGVLKLALHRSSYDWTFVGIPGTSLTSTGSQACHADTKPPAEVEVGGQALSQRFQLDTRFAVSWRATDADSGVASFDVRVLRIGPAGNRYPIQSWLDATADTSAHFEGVPGSTYCFSARARDEVGNVSAWSSWECTALPLDDRALRPHGGWTRDDADDFYLDTRSSTTRSGARLVRTRLSARHLGLLAVECPGCGVVELRWNGALLRRVNLSSDRRRGPQVVGQFSFERPHSGTLAVRVVSAGKRVVVDGLAVSTAT
jgi:acid phosphatase type 7